MLNCHQHKNELTRTNTVCNPFVKTSETSRVETRQGPDCITQGLMAHHTLSQRLIHSQEEKRREEKRRRRRKKEERRRKKKERLCPTSLLLFSETRKKIKAIIKRVTQKEAETERQRNREWRDRRDSFTLSDSAQRSWSASPRSSEELAVACRWPPLVFSNCALAPQLAPPTFTRALNSRFHKIIFSLVRFR